MSRRPADSLAPQAHGDAHRVPKAPLAEPRQLGRPWAQPPIPEPSGRSALLEAIQPAPPLLFSRPLVVLKRQEVDRSEPNSVELLHPSGWHCLVAAACIQAALATVAHPQASGAMLLDGPIGLKSLKDLLS